MSTEMARTGDTQVAQNQTPGATDQFRIACQNFIQKLNSEPAPESIGETPDKRAKTITISHIEMTLDEFFFGLWETEDFKWAVIANEVVGTITLAFIHPESGLRMKRVGAASIEIMVNAGSDPLNVQNKKRNAMDMGFPKLKAECLKNAANSIGKMFGRDLNRKAHQVDQFNPTVPTTQYDELVTLYNMKKEELSPKYRTHAERIINNREVNSYTKLYKYLQTA